MCALMARYEVSNGTRVRCDLAARNFFCLGAVVQPVDRSEGGSDIRSLAATRNDLVAAARHDPPLALARTWRIPPRKPWPRASADFTGLLSSIRRNSLRRASRIRPACPKLHSSLASVARGRSRASDGIPENGEIRQRSSFSDADGQQPFFVIPISAFYNSQTLPLTRRLATRRTDVERAPFSAHTHCFSIMPEKSLDDCGADFGIVGRDRDRSSDTNRSMAEVARN